MAGRSRVRINKAVAVAMAAALLALLFAAGEAAADNKCRVDEGTVMLQCASACSGGGEPRPSKGCCDALRNADYGCLCKRYRSELKDSRYASCAIAIPSKCNPNAPKSC